MIFDIDNITDGGLDFQLFVQKDCFDIVQEDCNLVKAVEVQGSLTRLDSEVFLRGRVRTGLLLKCSRCLSSMNFRVDAKLFARYIPKLSSEKFGEDQEFNGQDAETEYYSENKLDIAGSVYDAILLDVPMVCLCQLNCKGLCEKCGQNLNESICYCGKNKPIDPRLEVLSQLRDKLK